MIWKSSHDVIESAFHVCRDMLWKKNFILLKKSLSSCRQKCFPCPVGIICEKCFSKKLSSFFQTLEKRILADLIRTAFYSCRGMLLENKSLETYVESRKLSSKTVSRSYNVCVPRVLRKLSWDNLRLSQKLFCCCSCIEHSGKKLKILKILSEKTSAVVARSALHVSRKTLWVRTLGLISVKFVFLGAQTFQLVMTKTHFTCAEDHFERRMIKFLIIFSRFCLEIVGQCCVIITNTFSRFCQCKNSWKKYASSELWVEKQRPLLSKTQITCAGFFWSKSKKR